MTAQDSALSTQHSSSEASQVRHCLKCLVGRLDRLAVELEGALGLDQRDQLLDRVDVAAIQIPLQHLARAVLAGAALDRGAGGVGLAVEAAAEQVQSLRVDELEDAELSDLRGRGLPGAEDRDRAVLADLDLGRVGRDADRRDQPRPVAGAEHQFAFAVDDERSEEHTSELQSPCNLVCRLLLEKKKKKK